jgi:hypothetical protein
MTNDSRRKPALHDPFYAETGTAFRPDDPAKYPEFMGHVATVCSHPLSMGGRSNSHSNGNAGTYMNVGEGSGHAEVVVSSYPSDHRAVVASLTLTRQEDAEAGRK